MRRKISQARRLVVKVGSALVTNNGAGLASEFIEELARQIARLREDGREVLLVSSGAIAAGMQRLGWSVRPHAMHELQAAAAVGQMGLAQAYESCFSQYGLKTAQLLLTHEDLAGRLRYLNARSTLIALLELGVIPVINENDTVVTDEIKFGDNDTLGALVANLVEAEALIILTDQAGLFTADPRKDPGSAISMGGITPTAKAALRAARSGAHTLIASGREADVLPRLARGESIGTLLFASATPLAARKQWLADHLQLAGSLILDAGAAKALASGKSLLPIGVTAVEGEFERGAAVACRSADGREIARGLVNYSSSEARRIARQPSSEIEALLGYLDEPEMIHRDNLVLL